MNNLTQSNIVQLCSIVVCDRFAMEIAMKLRRNMCYNLFKDWERFIERCPESVLFQSKLSLNWPKTKKIQEDWEHLIKANATRLATNTVNTFLLCLPDE